MWSHDGLTITYFCPSMNQSWRKVSKIISNIFGEEQNLNPYILGSQPPLNPRCRLRLLDVLLFDVSYSTGSLTNLLSSHSDYRV